MSCRENQHTGLQLTVRHASQAARARTIPKITVRLIIVFSQRHQTTKLELCDSAVYNTPRHSSGQALQLQLQIKVDFKKKQKNKHHSTSSTNKCCTCITSQYSSSWKTDKGTSLSSPACMDTLTGVVKECAEKEFTNCVHLLLSFDSTVTQNSIKEA